MKNILIPTDFSDNANSAIDYALELYTNKNCAIYFLHSTYMLNPESRELITSHYLNKIKDQGLNNLEKLKSKKKTKNTNHIFKSIITDKKLNIAIDKGVKKNNIELIIMGTKGATASVEFFAGSNTIDIISRIKGCPVLVIPDNYNFVVPKQIAFPTDFSRFYDTKELEPLKKITKLYNSEIRVLHIKTEEELSDIQEHNKELLEDHLDDFKHCFYHIPYNSKKAKNIEDFIENFKIDMLVMVNYKHSIIENILKEPVIKNLMFHPKVPILVIPT